MSSTSESCNWLINFTKRKTSRRKRQLSMLEFKLQLVLRACSQNQMSGTGLRPVVSGVRPETVGKRALVFDCADNKQQTSPDEIRRDARFDGRDARATILKTRPKIQNKLKLELQQALQFTSPPVLICACNRLPATTSPKNFSRPCDLESSSRCWFSPRFRKCCSVWKRSSRAISDFLRIRSRIFNATGSGTANCHSGIPITTAAFRSSLNRPPSRSLPTPPGAKADEKLFWPQSSAHCKCSPADRKQFF